MKLIFLDIDGVLNTHDDVFKTGINSINRELMGRLNRIVAATGAELVISSAWRYMILNGAMELDGFRYLLNTHGLDPKVRLHGHTASDEMIYERGDQILDYVEEVLLAGENVTYVVLDDGSEEPQLNGRRTLTEALLAAVADRWVKTDSNIGLDEACVQHAISLLNAPV